MFKVKKLETTEEIIEFTRIFNRVIGYSNVPWQYHASGECYALINNGKMEAGFCLIPGWFNLRAVLQMPEEKQRAFYDNDKMTRNLCDLTGYFINGASFYRGLVFTLFLVMKCLLYKKKYFIYTYPEHEHGLEKYYAKGNPKRIHTGIPVKLSGHSDNMESEHVEVLTRLGVCRIFYCRTKRLLELKKLRGNK